MKRIFFIFAVVIICTMVTMGARSLRTYYDNESSKFATATKIVQNLCLKRIREGERENNQYKVKYYTYYYHNAGLVVIDLGADYFLSNNSLYY